MKRFIRCLIMVLAAVSAVGGEYTNPILPADYSDPDVVRVGTDYYMTASSFNMIPGLPILHSEDLVHWTIIGHGIDHNPEALFSYKNRKVSELDYDRPRLGNGVYAPAIRHHGGFFWIYWGDPDAGVYMIKAKDAAGPWSKPVLVHKASGWIDPCPLWNEITGKAYLSHAFAKSRAGVNGRIEVVEMSSDGTRLIGEPVTVFDAENAADFPADRYHKVIEGTKFMQRDGWVYILCPAGGVELGWQTVMRSKNPMGPYEIRTICETGDTTINGPHQGGLVDTPAGNWWFIHFQYAGTLGRIVWLEPAVWKDGWPVIGIDPDGDGMGNPVLRHAAPLPFVEKSIQMSDDFSGSGLGLQWQWPANPQADWAEVEQGALFMPAQLIGNTSLINVPGVLTQMFPGYGFSATVKMQLESESADVRAGLAVMGKKTFDVGVQPAGEKQKLSVRYQNIELVSTTVPTGCLWLRLETDGELPLPVKRRKKQKTELTQPYQVEGLDRWTGTIQGQFYYSMDGVDFIKFGPGFEVRTGVWIGARVGLYSVKNNAASSGALRADSFDITLPE